MLEIMKKCLVEFIGAFFLVFTVCMSVFVSGASSSSIAPFAIGFMLMVMVYAGGHISGGHYNPAVSLAAALRGALSWKDFAPYVAAQLLGGVLASLLAGTFIGFAPSSEPFSIGGLIIGEFLFTFALCYIVLNVATSDDTVNNSFYGLAIGSTVVVGAIATSSICYGAFNPAVALGVFALGSMSGLTVLATILTNIVAAAAAAFVYKFTNNDQE